MKLFLKDHSHSCALHFHEIFKSLRNQFFILFYENNNAPLKRNSPYCDLSSIVENTINFRQDSKHGAQCFDTISEIAISFFQKIDH